METQIRQDRNGLYYTVEVDDEEENIECVCRNGKDTEDPKPVKKDSKTKEKASNYR